MEIFENIIPCCNNEDPIMPHPCMPNMPCHDHMPMPCPPMPGMPCHDHMPMPRPPMPGMPCHDHMPMPRPPMPGMPCHDHMPMPYPPMHPNSMPPHPCPMPPMPIEHCDDAMMQHMERMYCMHMYMSAMNEAEAYRNKLMLCCCKQQTR